MPSAKAARSSFTRALRKVRQYLRDTCGSYARPLSDLEIKPYGSFPNGWRIFVDIAGSQYELVMLLPKEFPYVRPTIVLVSPNRQLHWPLVHDVWPHVEDRGRLCLPRDPVVVDDPVMMIARSISAACNLVDMNSPQPDFAEFRREFVSYWNRSLRPKSKKIRSLVNPSGQSRKVHAWSGPDFDLIAESVSEIERWLMCQGISRPANGFPISSAIFAMLAEPPAPHEFPDNAIFCRNWLRSTAPSALSIIESMLPKQKDIIVLLAAQTATGVGLGGVTMSGARNPRVRGYAKGTAPRNLVLDAWFANASFGRVQVDRFNGSWVHGRENNNQFALLREKKVTILGCGAVGSGIAVRLAQAGIGTITLVDPERLEAANVGRHALGIGVVGAPKASALASHLRFRFPHALIVRDVFSRWEDLVGEIWDQVCAGDLIVSAMGDWGAEGPLNEWHVASKCRPPIIYAWVEEFAAASHALLVANENSCLKCLISKDGKAVSPETDWEDVDPIVPEPACGGEFQPFGPVDLSYAEAIASELCIDYLLGTQVENCVGTYSTSTDRLARMGGTWSESHMRRRPAGFSGSFMERKPALRNPACTVCGPK